MTGMLTQLHITQMLREAAELDANQDPCPLPISKSMLSQLDGAYATVWQRSTVIDVRSCICAYVTEMVLCRA